LLKWLGREDAPLIFRWRRWDPALWEWGLRFLANCPAPRARINTGRTLGVALYSRRCLQELRAATGLDYDQRTAGILHVYRDSGEYAHARKAAEVMRGYGLDRRVVTAAECAVLEPALGAVKHRLAGGIHTPDDESGDAHKFTQLLAALAAERHGVEFLFGTRVDGIEKDGDRVAALRTARGRLQADAYVVALASWTPVLLRPLGLKLPIVPAKGYSITVPAARGAPVMSITDDEHKMVYSRLGDRLRVAGTAEMAGWDHTLVETRWRAILNRARALLPEGADWPKAEPWAGLRPVTPDSVPVLGATPLKNLWLDTGHGTLGWTMACGSGRVIADLVSGKTPEIDVSGLGMDRF
jgi:D-amino-acid dehydrogenase